MGYGLGLTYLGAGLENAVDKAWHRMWRKALSLPRTTSGLAILKMMRVPDMVFRARKLNAMVVGRAKNANPNTLLSSVYRFATDGPRRKTKKLMVVRSRRNPLVTNTPLWGYDYRKEERSLIMGLVQNGTNIVASRTSCSNAGIDTFLKHTSGIGSMRDTKRKLLLWRTGVIPGKPQICQGCNTGAQTTRDHVIKCSGLSATLSKHVLNTATGATNVLDAALNRPDIWKWYDIWGKVKEGFQTVWSKCLGRRFHSDFEGNPGAEQ